MQGDGVRVAVLGIASFLGVVALTPVARQIALRYGITDRPGHGKLHTKVTPYLGGVAILITALVASSFLPSWSAHCVGFLLYNWHPARIFLGDAGSLFLGFLLAALALELRSTAGHRAVLAAVVLLAGMALFDTTLVVVSRVRAGRSIMVGGTDHTSH